MEIKLVRLLMLIVLCISGYLIIQPIIRQHNTLIETIEDIVNPSEEMQQYYQSLVNDIRKLIIGYVTLYLLLTILILTIQIKDIEITFKSKTET
jgi:predicted PurR-regulated permease PerM